MTGFYHNTIELPNIEAITTDAGRVYHTPAGDLPSITTVLGLLSEDGISTWRDRIGHEEADTITRRAATRGTRIHELCEDYVNNKPVEFKTPLESQMFNSMKHHLDENIKEVIGQELPLYSKHLGIAGRVDLVCNWAGKRAVIDYKTSRKPKKEEYILGYKLQATAYCIMFEEMTGIGIDRFGIVIGVDQEPSQVFYGKRNDYVEQLVHTIERYYNEKNLTHPNPGLFSRFN